MTVFTITYEEHGFESTLSLTAETMQKAMSDFKQDNPDASIGKIVEGAQSTLVNNKFLPAA